MRGTIIHHQIMDRDVYVYLPPDYNRNKQKRYPVIYVQDGAYLFRDSGSVWEALMESGYMQPVVMVGVEPKSRIHEYTPWPSKALSLNLPDFKGLGTEYAYILTNGIRPYINEKYRVRTEASHTGLIGASLGGLVSIYIADLYPHVFHKIGLLSASLWYEGMGSFIKDRLSLTLRHYVYLYVGEWEGSGQPLIEPYMVPRTQMMYELLRKQLEDQVALHIKPKAMHERKYFVSQFPAACTWLFPPLH